MESAAKRSPTQAASRGHELRALSDQLRELAVIAGSTPDGERSVIDAAGFQRRFSELEVDLLGLQAIEQRFLNAEKQADRQLLESDSPVGLAVLADVLACRCAELADRIAQLTVDCLGYYALPYPDPLLIDNEGPIGHYWALPAMRALQAYFEPAGNDGFEGRNRIAGRLFNH